MPFLLLLVGAVLLVSAIKNTQGDVAAALTTDVPGFLRWALAVVAVGGLGYIPGMKTPSRLFLTLIAIVIVLTNYRQFIAGFAGLEVAPAGTASVATPGQAYAANPNAPNITAANVSGTSPAASQAGGAGGSAPAGAFDPAAFLAQIEAGLGGFGGSV